jgi:hypothetical protein
VLLKKTKKGTAPVNIQSAVAPMLVAMDSIRKYEKAQEKALCSVAKGLPAYVLEWIEGVKGFGRLGLCIVLGETGDLANYSGPAKVWKRMGMGLVDGERQRKHSNKEKAEAAGYNPRRRSVMFVFGECLIKLNKDYYRDVYLLEKAKQETAHPELSKMHRHRRAKRFMEKRLLRQLWRVWNREPEQ